MCVCVCVGAYVRACMCGGQIEAARGAAAERAAATRPLDWTNDL